MNRIIYSKVKPIYGFKKKGNNIHQGFTIKESRKTLQKLASISSIDHGDKITDLICKYK